MASKQLELYYYPTSFFSQKVLIALKEKRLPYIEHVVNLPGKEVNEPWFLRLNPKGQVPALKVGSRLINESERIIEVLDGMLIGSGEEVRLIPLTGTPEGDLVSEWRRKLDAIEVELITFGVILNPELHTAHIKVPSFVLTSKDAYNKGLHEMIFKLEKMKKENPDLTEALDNKIKLTKLRTGASHYDLEVTRKTLDDLEGVMDDVEAQLRASKKANVDAWLCGHRFTIADINLCVLLGRLDLVGYLHRYVDPSKRPALVKYWNAALQRETVGSTVDVISALKTYYKKKMLRHVAWGALVAGVVVVAGLVVARYRQH